MGGGGGGGVDQNVGVFIIYSTTEVASIAYLLLYTRVSQKTRVKSVLGKLYCLSMRRQIEQEGGIGSEDILVI